MNAQELSWPVHKRHDTVVILHLYYPELWDEIYSYLAHLEGEFDLLVSVPNDLSFSEDIIRQSVQDAQIHRCENRGRDIAPFLAAFSAIAPLDYKYICKIHTKKSSYFSKGDAWRRDMLSKLLGSRQTIDRIQKTLDEHPDCGLIAPEGHVLPLMPGSYYWGANAPNLQALAGAAGIPVTDVTQMDFSFVAGSMFWVRSEAFALLLREELPRNFEVEEGQLDGTLAHAYERFFGLVTSQSGFKIAESDCRGVKPAEVPVQLHLLLQTTHDLARRLVAAAQQLTTATENQSIQALRDKYAGQTAWIVGKGPSLVMLSREHIGAGPVIAINEAITAIEVLALDNPLYSMQKDADEYDELGVVTRFGNDPFVPISRAALLVHRHESPDRMRDYRPRYVFDNVSDFGLAWSEFSSLVAIAVARLMGCSDVVFVAHDACVFGDTRKCIPQADGSYRVELPSAGDDNYLPHRARIDEYLASVGMAAAWLTPEPGRTRRLGDDRRPAVLLQDIEQLQAEARLRDGDIERLAESVRAREAEEIRLHAELDEARRRLEAITSELQDANARIDSLALAEANTRGELDRAHQRVQVLTGERDAATSHVDALLASASWRWMAPLRVANRLLMRRKR